MDSQVRINEIDLKFKIPFGMIISGPSNSGKTEFLLKLLKNTEKLFSPPPKVVVYCYGEYHSHITQMESQGIRINSGMPSEELLQKLQRPYLLILDDLILSADEKTLRIIHEKSAPSKFRCDFYNTKFI